MAEKAKQLKIDDIETPKDSAKEKALADALKTIEKAYGKGSIMKLGDANQEKIEVIPSGSIALDMALGVGGYPKGRIIEVFGPESSGKTTFALHAIAEAQKKGGYAAFIDAEHALDPTYAKALGVDTDNLILSQPDNGEQALEIVEALVRSNVIDIIEGDMGDSHVGLQARLMSQAMRKLAGIINKSKTVAIFINQIREKVGVLFGSPETTSGGRALKFYSTIRLDIRRVDQIKQGTEAIGNLTRIKVVKNKVAPPFKIAEVDSIYGKGISYEGEVLDLATNLDIVEKSGSWFSYNGERLGQGRETVKEVLRQNPELAKEIEQKVREKILG